LGQISIVRKVHGTFILLEQFGQIWHSGAEPQCLHAIESSLDIGHFEPLLLQNLSELTFNQDFGRVSLGYLLQPNE
jgi:hypothetical protein